jgi:hypothetical protein
MQFLKGFKNMKKQLFKITKHKVISIQIIFSTDKDFIFQIRPRFRAVKKINPFDQTLFIILI